MGFWSGFTRTAAQVEHDGSLYRVELRLFTLGRNVTFLRDGVPVQRSSTPARLRLDDQTVIEVAASDHGFSRAVLRHRGRTTRLEPADGTWEAARRRWGRDHPVLSRAVAVVATLVVCASLALGLMQVLELVSGIEWVRELLGGRSFTSPVALPPAALVAVGLIVGAAALERALRMR